MSIRDTETVTDVDALRGGTRLLPDAVGIAVIGPSAGEPQRPPRDDRATGPRPLTSRRWLMVVGGAILPVLLLAAWQSWLFLVASELIASSMGLGFRLTDSQSNGRIDRVFLAIIVLAVLGTLTDAVVGVFQRYAVRKWA